MELRRLQTSPVSWLGDNLLREENSRAAGLRPSRSEKRCSGAQVKRSPYSRAAATALHRLPEHEVRG